MPLKMGVQELVMIMAIEAAPESSNKTAQLILLITTVRLAGAWYATLYTISGKLKIAAARQSTLSHHDRRSGMHTSGSGAGGQSAACGCEFETATEPRRAGWDDPLRFIPPGPVIVDGHGLSRINRIYAGKIDFC